MREPSSPPYHLRTKLLETLRLGTSAGLEEHASSSDPDASSDASARRASVTFFGDVLGVACGPTSGGLAKKEYGIEELRWTVLQAAGLDGWALRKKGRRRVKTPVPVGTAEEKEDDVDAHEEEEELTEEDVSEK
ncbi:MAG: hypothetical protein M4579_002790 [Chaenotheca gracillima]|nr:MAG: hypothetical protein M4579_002790 [Chaenotheca gracillima]